MPRTRLDGDETRRRLPRPIAEVAGIAAHSARGDGDADRSDPKEGSCGTQGGRSITAASGTLRGVKLGTCVAILVASSGCSSGRPPPVMPSEPLSTEPVVGRSVSDLDLKPLGGRSGVRLSEFQGKVTLLNVWASWCAPCKVELPRLDEAAPRLRAKGIEIVAASVDESTSDAEE